MLVHHIQQVLRPLGHFTPGVVSLILASAPLLLSLYHVLQSQNNPVRLILWVVLTHSLICLGITGKFQLGTLVNNYKVEYLVIVPLTNFTKISTSKCVPSEGTCQGQKAATDDI